MSKRAEEAALKAYPVKMTPLVYQDLIDQFGGKTEIDVNTYPRCLFQEAYEQAEKDLALTWEDIRAIDELLTLVYDPDNEKGYYTRVLEEFNKRMQEKCQMLKL